MINCKPAKKEEQEEVRLRVAIQANRYKEVKRQIGRQAFAVHACASQKLKVTVVIYIYIYICVHQG